MSKLKNRPLTELMAHFLKRNCPKKTENRFLSSFFHSGVISAIYGPKKIPKSPQVSRKYGPLSTLKEKPLTK
jgi:hypothetical protein